MSCLWFAHAAYTAGSPSIFWGHDIQSKPDKSLKGNSVPKRPIHFVWHCFKFEISTLKMAKFSVHVDVSGCWYGFWSTVCMFSVSGVPIVLK